MPNDYTPFTFQTAGVDWISSARSNGKGYSADPLCGLIGDEMGLGKTAQALLAITPLIKAGKRVLILAPGATIIQWQRNWDRWINNCEPDEFGTDGLYALRSATVLIPRGFSCIASHQMLAKADFVQSVIAANFDGLILDEAHKFGSRDTKRIKHLLAVRNISKSKFESCRILLTGTPVRNYADEIYNLLHFVSPESFRNFPDFARKYLTRDERALWNPGQFHLDVKPFYLRRTVAEVQKDLPSLRRQRMYTEITDPWIKDAYNRELDALDNFMSNGKKVDSMSLLGYLVKLRHMTGIAKAKEPSIIEPIVDYLLSDNQRGGASHDSNGSEAEGNKVAVGLIHRLVADRLERSLLNEIPNLKVFRIQGGTTAIEKDQAVQGFQSCKAPAVILMNMEAGGSGIDGLQNVCSQAYIFERMWNGADMEQFTKRIHRTGQKFSVSVDDTICKGTVEEFFDNLCQEKQRITGSVNDEDYEYDGGFIRELAEQAVRSRL